MNPSKLLLRLISFFQPGIVEHGGGGEAVLDEQDEQGEHGETPEGDGSDESDDSGNDDADTSGDDQGEEEGEGEADNGEAGDQPDAEGGLTVTLGGEPSPEEDEKRAPDWLRELRKSNREKDRRIRELEAKVSSANPAPAAVVVGEKPTLEGCDYDAEKFEKELDGWHARKLQADEQKRERDAAESRSREAWQKTTDAYGAEKAKLKLPNYEDAEGAVQDALSVTQQGVILHGLEPKRAALLTYALGNNPAKLKELAAVTDPVKFAVAVARLEMQMKVTNKKGAAPAPERTVRSTVSGSSAVDSQMERLRKEARQTGDYSKVTEFRRQQDAKKQKRA